MEYYIGLDIGTGSVGWAVTDPQYNVIKKNGKALWGVRLFDTANTAEERRTFRAQRRRTQRNHERLELLQELFSEEISKVDPGFFLRMKESRYIPKDKKDLEGNTPAVPYALFADTDYSDKDYHKKYPTIYHLRSDLIHNPSAHDVREVYLALHHIFKHRGHFLFEGSDLSSVTNFDNAFKSFLTVIADVFGMDEEPEYDDATINAIKATLSDRMLGRSEKKKRLQKQLTINDTDYASSFKALAGLLAGTKTKLSDIYNDESLKEAEKKDVCFDGSSYEADTPVLESLLDDRFALLEAAKAIYDWSVLVDILGGHQYLSDAKTASFDKHRSDLDKLKSVLKSDTKAYRKMFYDPDTAGNYCCYIGMTKKNGTKLPVVKHASKDDFYAFCKNMLKNSTAPECATILSDIEAGVFMPKQLVKDNSVIPYQVHLQELNAILENAEKYLPFLTIQDTEGYTVSDKLRSLLTFRIPYYVGPLNTFHSDKGGNAWMVRKQDGKIYPWNFSDMIDEEESANRFIRRMTNKCTYMLGKDVLPKESLLYTRFMVLNELNNLKLDDEPITISLKQDIYNDLFCHTANVTQKKLRSYLIGKGAAGKTTKISGIDGDFKASLKAVVDFNAMSDAGLSVEDKEALILDISLFNESPKMLEKRIRTHFPHLSEKQINTIRNRKYSGWGRLSKEFLTELYAANPETGEAWNIITALWETNDNLMQLLGSKYEFSSNLEAINAEAAGINGEIRYEDVKAMYISPAVKRPVWQTIRIVQELKGILGCEPKRIFVEVAREEGEKKRTVSRKTSLQQLYAHCEEVTPELRSILASKNDNELRSDRLYLYLTQLGKCMYSGEPIDIEDLYNTNIYDVDHIYPQSKTMDDSLKNRVLVKKVLNEEKSDTYPIKQEIRDKMKSFWTMLLKRGLIDQEKYNRLVRHEELKPEELAGFISRQLVETNQSNKAVTELLRKAYPNSTVVFSKAGVVSHFRQEFNFIKVRELNEYHHAKDAYLNIVCGNAYYVKFNKDPFNFIRENPGRTYNLEKFFNNTVKRGSDVGWIAPSADNAGTILTVRHWMSKNNILFTRKVHEEAGGLFDQQLMRKGLGQMPIKNGDDNRLSAIENYGGYNKIKGSYFILVESVGKKGKLQRTINHVPVYLSKKLDDVEKLETYCRDELGLINPVILEKRIPIDTLFCIDGFYMHLSGRTSKQLIFKNANNLILSANEAKTVKKIVKYCERLKTNPQLSISAFDDISDNSLVELYAKLQRKLQTPPYSAKLEIQAKTMEKGFELFNVLCAEKKCQLLNNVLKLFSCNSSTADLKLIAGPGAAGIITQNMDVSTVDFSIVNQSVTGFYESLKEYKKL